MKSMISWNARSRASPTEYDRAQQRILGGYMLATSRLKSTSSLCCCPRLNSSLIPIDHAVRAERDVTAWRDSLEVA